MKSPFNFIIEPIGDRYNNTKKIGDKELLLNTEISNHEFINRTAIIKSTPLAYKTELKTGDEIIVHHNVFRRWYDVKGREKNSKSFISENLFSVTLDQIFLYKRNGTWKTLEDYCFIQPIKNNWKYSLNPEKPLTGIVKYGNNYIKEGDLIGFSPGDEYEFTIDGERLYRVMNKYITVKHESKGNEEAYNPSWA